jgi:hypothetical protein
VAEWFKAAVLKTARGASPSWVRIPPLPPGNHSPPFAVVQLSPIFQALFPHFASVRVRRGFAKDYGRFCRIGRKSSVWRKRPKTLRLTHEWLSPVNSAEVVGNRDAIFRHSGRS